MFKRPGKVTPKPKLRSLDIQSLLRQIEERISLLEVFGAAANPVPAEQTNGGHFASGDLREESREEAGFVGWAG